MCVLPVPGAPYSRMPRLRCCPLARSRRLPRDAEHLPLDLLQERRRQDHLRARDGGPVQEVQRVAGSQQLGTKLITCPRNTLRSAASCQIARITCSTAAAGPDDLQLHLGPRAHPAAGK